MLTAKVQDETTVIAWEMTKARAPFFCPECNSEMVLKKGAIKAHHFAHVPPVDCDYGYGESAEHLAIKRAVYEGLQNNTWVSKLALERDLKTVRPDISCYIGSTPVAIEIQRSNLDEDTILRRFYEYNRMGIALLWILTASTPEHGDEFKIRKWQKLLMQLQYGHLFFHRSGAKVSGVRLKSISMTRDEYYYDDGTTVGGGTYYYKSIRQALYVGSFHIADDFAKHARKPYRDIPGGLVWLPKAMCEWWGV